MSTPRLKPLIAGNWKMNGLRSSLNEILAMGTAFEPALAARLDLLICPPATLVYTAAATAIGTRIAIGAQDCHAKGSGAYTGDVSATMLSDAGATYVILGHSERRSLHKENDALVHAKAEAAQAATLTAIICVGETRAERDAGKAEAVVRRQLRGSVPVQSTAHNLVVAYEPVWAIGTGLTPTVADVAQMHAAIRAQLCTILGREKGQGVRLLYGGSVKPSNAGELLSVENVNGALVGGASLKAQDFMAIAQACP
jgi:triosephosphate isomerase (TIM)